MAIPAQIQVKDLLIRLISHHFAFINDLIYLYLNGEVMKLKSMIMISALLFPTLSSASIMSLPTGVEAQGSIEFDEINSFGASASQNDTFGIGTNTSSVTDTIVTGDNPVTGSMVAPMSFDLSLSAANTDVDFEYYAYMFDVTLSNNLLSDTVEFFFSFDFFQQAEANANDLFLDDAFVDTSLSLTDNLGSAMLFSSLGSDLNNGVSSLSDSFDFSFVLAAGESLTFSGLIELNAYAFGETDFDLLTSGQLALTDLSVTRVAEPSLLALFAMSCLLLTRRRSFNNKTF